MNEKQAKKQSKSWTTYLVGAIIVMMVLQLIVGPMLAKQADISYTDFKARLRTGEVVAVEVSDEVITGQLSDGQLFRTVRVEDAGLLEELEAARVEVTGKASSDGSLFSMLLSWILPLALLGGLWYWMMGKSKGGTGVGGGAFSFGKSKARMIQGEQTGVTFEDVGSATQAVTELREVTEFLRSPERFQRLGGKMPKGVLLVGPPGTGKTLLARATAGEAHVPFYSLSAAEFVEMFVGVGASRVRDLFEQAKKTAPSIIFIDEIDAIGGRRSGTGGFGSHEEREQTLNQLLAEMDGFEASKGVVVLAATNRPEVLDPALLRPGRFDRQISVDLPDLAGRDEILRIHARDVSLADSVDLNLVARITSGFSGADLANVLNEAALLAARKGRDAVIMVDIDEAIERVVAGSERPTRVMREGEKQTVAIHEAGHAIVASLLPGTDPVHKVTIVPRGRALGYTWQRPLEDRYLLSERELEARLAVLLGGRVAEALTLGEVSTGAADDLAKATDLARRMVTEYGMSPSLGPVRLASNSGAAYLGQVDGLDPRVSPQTATQVDLETRRILENAARQAAELLETHKVALGWLAGLLSEEETVSGEKLMSLLAADQGTASHQDIPTEVPTAEAR